MPYPKDDWTYEQFAATAQKLTKKAQGKTVQWGFVDDYPTWDAWVYAFGGSMVDNGRNPPCVPSTARGHRGGAIPRRPHLQVRLHAQPQRLHRHGGPGQLGLFHQRLGGHVPQRDLDDAQVPPDQGIRLGRGGIPPGPKGHRGFPLSAAGYGSSRPARTPIWPMSW